MKGPLNATNWAMAFVTDLFSFGARPTRIGLPRSFVTALARESRGLHREGPGALPRGVGFMAMVPVETVVAFVGRDGRMSITADEFTLNTHAGPVTFFSVD